MNNINNTEIVFVLLVLIEEGREKAEGGGWFGVE